MRITRDTLLDMARQNAASLAAKDRGLVCIYIVGSLLKEDPFLGGITDIDLVCIHDRPVQTRREVIRVTPELHLDLAHYEQAEFEPARKLRTNPWIGGAMESVPIVLRDPQRWYDFTRSGATAQFWRPENTAARARYFLFPARKAWSDLQEGAIPKGLKRTQAFLNALRDLANGVASLSGFPLPIRRLMLNLPEQASRSGLPEFTGEFVQLFTSSTVNDAGIEGWIDQYTGMFEALQAVEKCPAAIAPYRRPYFEKAIRTIYAQHPAAAIWIMLHTWTRAAVVLPATAPSRQDWKGLCKGMELDDDHLPGRLESLDHLLDTAEEAADRLQG